MPPPPRLLPDELVEEVLLRLEPENPAGLVRAGLVCTRWCRIVSDPDFRHRFREFHRNPPMLGMLCNRYSNGGFGSFDVAWFNRTTAFPRTDFPSQCVLDVRHGRVLCDGGRVLMVWDPITNEVQELPYPRKRMGPWSAAVLCAAAGACSHLDCHHGPFLIVFLRRKRNDSTVIYTYSSDAAAWSETAVCAQQPCLVKFQMGSVLLGNALYFGNMAQSIALKYDLELRQVSLIQLPALPFSCLGESLLTTTLIQLPTLAFSRLGESLLTTTEDGGLELVIRDYSRLIIWSRKDTHEVDAIWEKRIIALRTVFPLDIDIAKLGVNMIGSGVGIIFMRTGDDVYTIDLKTYKVKKVYKGSATRIFPYMSFYTSVLQVATAGEGPSAGASTTEQT